MSKAQCLSLLKEHSDLRVSAYISTFVFAGTLICTLQSSIQILKSLTFKDSVFFILLNEIQCLCLWPSWTFLQLKLNALNFSCYDALLSIYNDIFMLRANQKRLKLCIFNLDKHWLEAKPDQFIWTCVLLSIHKEKTWEWRLSRYLDMKSFNCGKLWKYIG